MYVCVCVCVVCVWCVKEYNRSVETARSGGQEVEELTQALSDTRVQCKALQLKNSELVRAHNELTQQLRKQVKKIAHSSICLQFYFQFFS